MTWPKQVPVLKPEDFVIGPYECGDRFCLIGWKSHVFPCVFDSKHYHEVSNPLWEVGGDQTIFHSQTPNTLVNRRRAARIWAKFIERLGYTEDGPTVEM